MRMFFFALLSPINDSQRASRYLLLTCVNRELVDLYLCKYWCMNPIRWDSRSDQIEGKHAKARKEKLRTKNQCHVNHKVQIVCLAARKKGTSVAWAHSNSLTNRPEVYIFACKLGLQSFISLFQFKLLFLFHWTKVIFTFF